MSDAESVGSKESKKLKKKKSKKSKKDSKSGRARGKDRSALARLLACARLRARRAQEMWVI